MLSVLKEPFLQERPENVSSPMDICLFERRVLMYTNSPANKTAVKMPVGEENYKILKKFYCY
ncbi:CFS_G0024210.mRNA.1.CDS.1 [Saccharomyces cerevisiae]|nr:CFS_G0024210.mRNA.1.CDS.1 [Saccharomyces cerevisiae]CAI7333154.1 CFS_G0024210.mRNA.1.CDS.1 [Saccharomyces cerevisiae]